MDSSEYESDAGASPSLSESDTSSVSSRSSSPGNLKIVRQRQATPRKKNNNTTSASTSTRKTSVRKRNNGNAVTSAQKVRHASGSVASASKVQPKQSTIDNATLSRKRKLPQTKTPPSSKPKSVRVSSAKSSVKRPRMNQRRRTKSERNTRAGKVVNVAVEEGVALDAEIDKFLEEKAIKNNLTATNVKSIIRHVITNNMVQKMIMSTVKKKGSNPDESSDDEAYFEPKLTRARTKLLLGNQNPTPLWPTLAVSSPAKAKKGEVSETHILIHEELPEDSSGDEEYIPRGDETHSDDESSSVASHASDVGSPQVSTPGSASSSGRRRDCSTQSGGSTPTSSKQSVFKTPPPIKPKCARKLTDSAIGQRTRSKLPLNDTPLEHLEMQFVPPDITTDMYDWFQSDNQDYLTFVQEFLRPAQNLHEGDDDEADPEYNVMEEEEEHDKEELRMDRAVKVSKKELNGLFEALFEEDHYSSGDNFDEMDFSSFCLSQLSNHMSMPNILDSVVDTQVQSLDTSGLTIEDVTNKTEPEKTPAATQSTSNTLKQQEERAKMTSVHEDATAITVAEAMMSLRGAEPSNVVIQNVEQQEPQFRIPTHPAPRATPSKDKDKSPSINEQRVTLEEKQPESPQLAAIQPITFIIVPPEASHNDNLSPPRVPPLDNPPIEEPWFNQEKLVILRHQMRQHAQLLAQSYVLAACKDEPYFKNITTNSKRMIIELKNFSRVNGIHSVFGVENVDPAWQLVNSWPPKSSSKSPIKKKILEEKYLNDYQNEAAEECQTRSSSEVFPRHVVKLISESTAFLFPQMLPAVYNLKSLAKTNFTLSEDILLVYGLEDLKEVTLTCCQKAKVISQTLLTVRTPEAVYHRLRNLRKTNGVATPAIKKYFTSGELPCGAQVPPAWDSTLLISPISQPQAKIPLNWRALFGKLRLLSDYKWNSERKSLKGKVKKALEKRKSPKKVKKSPQEVQSPPREEIIVNSTFPAGTSVVYRHIQENPDSTAIAILDDNGNPGAYMFVPNYAMPAPEQYRTPPKGTEACELRKYYHPVPLYHRPEEKSSPSKDDDSDPVLKITPVEKPFTSSPSKEEDDNSSEISFTTFTPVGKPFSLPGVDITGDFVSLASLGTPLKRAILEHIQEDCPSQPSPNKPNIERLSSPTKPSTDKLSSTKNSIEKLSSPTKPIIDISSSPAKRSIDRVSSPTKKLGTDRLEHSARTIGNYIRGSAQKDNHSDDDDDGDGSSSSSNSSSSGSSGSDSSSEEGPRNDDEDVNLTEYEDNLSLMNPQSPASPIQEVIILEDDDERSEAVETHGVILTTLEELNDSGDLQQSSGDSQGDKENSGQGGNEQNSSRNANQEEGPNDLGMDGVGTSSGTGGGSARDNDDEDENRKDNRSKSPVDNAENPDGDKEEDTEDEADAGHSSKRTKDKKSARHLKSQNQRISKNPGKSHKRSPGMGASPPKKRASKSVPIETMLEDDVDKDVEVCDAFMQAFLSRVQTVTEKRNPGLHNEFMKLLFDAGESSEVLADLLGRVKWLLKDYPELVQEFSAFIESDDVNIAAPVEDPNFLENQKTQAQLNFMKHLEKFTEKSPQLKAKILHKFKVIKEQPELSEMDVAKSLAPFFQGNPVMMNAFQALFPTVYRPQSIEAGDFEEIDLESEEAREDPNTEVVKLPEEKTIPATNTCPCICHENATHAYTSRVKHCNKCCIKDGKVFIHNGRVVRPVNVELTSPTAAKKIANGNSCKNCVPESSVSKVKDIPATIASKSKDEQDAKKSKVEAINLKPVVIDDDDLEEGEIVDEDDVVQEAHQNTKCDASSDSDKTVTPSRTEERKGETKVSLKPWTIEEDRLILACVQSEPSIEDAFVKLTSQLQQRDITEIESRCVELISLLQQSMNASAGGGLA